MTTHPHGDVNVPELPGPAGPEAQPAGFTWSWRLRQGIGAFERASLPVVLVATVLIFTFLKPGEFLTVSNIRALLLQNVPLLAMIIGICFVLATREFDLSVGAIAGASAALSVVAMARWNLGTAWAVVLGIALGAVLGLVNGILVSYLRLPSFIGTVATGSVISGVMLAICNTSVVTGITPGFLDIMTRLIGAVPVIFIAGAVVIIVAALTLRYTLFGRHATAIGDNPAAALIAGVNVRRVTMYAFLMSGLFAGVCGVLLASQSQEFYPDPAASLYIPAYAAAFLSLALGRGWRFNITGAVVGAVFLACIQTGVTMLNEPTWLAQLLQGIILVIAVLTLNRRRVAA